MTDLENTIFDLRAEFVIEALDLMSVHSTWTARHLAERRHELALEAFGKLLTAVRAAAEQMKAIRAVLADNELNGQAAAEYRSERDARRKTHGRAA